MATIYESMMVASVLVGMISIPAASQSIDSQNQINNDLNSISDESNVPEEVIEETSSDRFYREVSSAFGEFTTSITSDTTTVELGNSGAELSIERSPEETVYELTTSEGSMKQVKTPESSKEVYTTPEGTLTRKQENGAVREEFKGSDREKVDSQAESLRAMMEDRLEEVEERKQRIEEEGQPQLRLEVNPEDEYVVISNPESRSVDISGWEIKDSTSNSYTFDNVQIGEHSEVTLYSHEGEDTETEVYWGYSEGYSVWSQSGDTATLYDQEGEVMAEKSY